jgi:uncharacterized membrane protein YesL
MTGFFIKKAFYDGWDNLLQIVLINFFVILIALGGFSMARALADSPYIALSIIAVTIIAEFTLAFAISAVMARAASYRSFSFKDFFADLASTWKHGLLFGVIICALVFALTLAFPYYLGLGNFIGFVIATTLFWVVLLVALSLQWFIPIRTQLDTNFMKCLKKSFIIFFDNPGFSVFMFFYSLVLAALSLVMVFLAPGVAGILLGYNDAFHLRMYKYDWMEAHPELDFKQARKAIPWDELIENDRDIVGTRSLRSFIFPWKD